MPRPQVMLCKYKCVWKHVGNGLENFKYHILKLEYRVFTTQYVRARLRVFKLLTWKLRVLRRYSFFLIGWKRSHLVPWWEIECKRRRLRSCWCSRYKPTASLWASLMHVCLVILDTEPSRLKTLSFREISSTPRIGFSEGNGSFVRY